jgi:hypothetical protein
VPGIGADPNIGGPKLWLTPMPATPTTSTFPLSACRRALRNFQGGRSLRRKSRETGGVWGLSQIAPKGRFQAQNAHGLPARLCGLRGGGPESCSITDGWIVEIILIADREGIMQFDIVLVDGSRSDRHSA